MNEEQRKRFEQTRQGNAKAAEAAAAKPAKPNRARQGFRAQANSLNPHPAAQVFDSYGRPKKRSDHHSWIRG